MGNRELRLIFCLSFVVLLGACDFIPRGAGLQKEVLSSARENDADALPEFSIEAVTRENLSTFGRWPSLDPVHYHWIGRVDQPNTRIIRPGDTLKITVWSPDDNGLLTGQGQRNVTLTDNRVSSAGRIFLPYVGELKVSGMSPDRARARIQETYAPSLPSAQVQLEMVEGAQQTVSLIGGVGAPGAFTLPDNDYTILQLIAAGSGISNALNNPQVRLHRGSKIYGISAARLLASPKLDTTLVGGDKVFIEDDDRTFLSLGAAGTEAVHPFPKDQVSALEAMAVIGGLTDSRADAKGILILRRYPASKVTADRSGPDHPRTVFTLDLTSADGLFSADQFQIQSGDLIYVSESPLTAARSIFSLFGSLVGLSNSVSD